ncbi:unnamed protein product [Clonostachys byssicola]|uniref:MARVEL domain-containing protein n=1 Tax=Clonostachys byssicola TaxID=160290 RepID=A0A9N9U341_9HYPO|nr:unnamed protein product [Clonostachys byssicola]
MSQPTQIMAPQQLPPPHVSPKKTWGTKIGFRIASFIFCIILIGLSAHQTTSRYYDGVYALVFMVPPAAFSAIWNVAEGICILVRRGRRGMHPAAIVSIDLLLWLAYVALTITYALFGFYDGYYYYYDSYYNSRYNTPGTIQAIVAFGALEVICHFSLFVIGCVETNIRNRAGPQIVYYAAPPGMQVVPFPPNGAFPAPGQGVAVPQNAYFQPAPNGSYPPQQPHYSWAPAPAPAGVSPQSNAAVPHKEGP